MKKKGDKHKSAAKITAKRKAGTLIAVAVVVFACILFLKSLRRPVESRVQRLVRVAGEQAGRRDHKALSVFRLRMDRIEKTYSMRFNSLAAQKAKDASGYGTCTKTIYYLAKDKVFGGSEARDYIYGMIGPDVQSWLDRMGRDINDALADLERDLRQSTLSQAKDLMAIGLRGDEPPIEIKVNDTGATDIDQALHNLGIEGVTLGIVIPFDIYSLLKTRVLSRLAQNIVELAGQSFSREVAEATAAMTAPAADGPLPVGDIIAVGGAVWTAYDIHDARKDFKHDLRVSLENMSQDAFALACGRAVDYADGIIKKYQQVQDEMGKQALNNLEGGAR